MDSAGMNPINHQSLKGFTLLELMVASMLSLVVILAIGQVDVSRLLLSNQANRTATATADAELALAHMARTLEQADLVNRLGADNVQIRIPQYPADLDDPASYRWVQYRYDGTLGQIIFYDPAIACTIAGRFWNLQGLSVEYRDEVTTPPPGGDPTPQDNNMLELVVQADVLNPQTGTITTYTYREEVAIRAGAYTNIDSGLSESAPGPPGSCS